MNQYNDISIAEREKILILYTKKRSLRSIGKELGRNVSTISREISRNKVKKGYSAIAAENKYQARRKKCVKNRLLENDVLKNKIRSLFLDKQWSPEQISNRLVYENSPYKISYNTIYRGIYSGIFDTAAQKLSRGNRGAIRKLRHRGKTRNKSGIEESRGKMIISNTIHQRPIEAKQRKVIGNWEADTLLGKRKSACLITMTDMCSRYLLGKKIPQKQSEMLANGMVTLLSNIPKNALKTITPDRGKEFSKHSEISQLLDNVQFYFSDPRAPWQRGTNENTNGLLREYFPKSFDIASLSDYDVFLAIDKLNKRPRKCLHWKSPFEVFFNTVLHLT